MEIKNSKKLLSEIDSNLKIIFNSSALLNKLKDETFEDVVLKQISILKFIEKKAKVKESDADLWIKKLNDINGSKREFIELNYSNQDDIVDDINYLSVYVQNMFKKPLSEFKKDDIKLNISSNDNKTVDSKVNDNMNANPMVPPMFQNGMGNQFNSPENYQLWQNEMQMMVARNRLQQMVNTGEFYQYKTKPLIIRIIKYIISGVAIGLALISILIGIFLLLSNGIKISSAGKEDVLTINYFTLISQIIYALLFLWIGYIFLKPLKNDNQKYSYNKFLGYMMLIIIIYFFFSQITVSFLYQNISIVESNSQQKIGFNGFIICNFIQVGLFGIALIVNILGLVFSPKPDIERINAKLAQIMDELKSGNNKDAAKPN
ncbi:hypothetical protein [Malacoplasma iowae]|uniref:Uncharacterized protein n=1 Tax=Malacoplasma iowae 695 TaxID=1048830 RepID=A0A6P1LEZ8_MALIO|nr:hypothetical protein [Malacoplasma iowae]VEU61973.1 Uncharacterised protein [Mycoplasmopsis fermentans]EGZ31562.1 putative integral membrane protein [Malacoplasma iowae 695]QHG90028.1 hypothetical protein EER00_04000 [Malacoplasma iowae 695]WPL36243.1 hypothetical protein QX180_02380 [Malacoplasma iowae]VEU70717.1 Uncharacterised protein [Malacoplasma iowae]